MPDMKTFCSPRMGVHLPALVAAIVEVSSPVVDFVQEPPGPNLLPVNTLVRGSHGWGVIVGYNNGRGIYHREIYPYAIFFEDGYLDYYSGHEFMPFN